MVDSALLTLSAFLTSSAVTYGYSPYSRKLGLWLSRKNLITAGRFVFQSSGQPSRFTNTVVMPVAVEKRYGILDIFVEIGVEDALIHEVQTRADIEQDPTEIVKPQRREHGRVALHSLFNRLAVLADRVFPSGLDLRNDREAIVGRSSWKDWTVAALLKFEISLLGDRHCGGFVQSGAAGRGWLQRFDRSSIAQLGLRRI